MGSRKLKVFLGVLCIALSAITLFSVLSHAGEIQLKDSANPVDIRSLQISNEDSGILLINTDPMVLKDGKSFSMLAVWFADSYEAQAAFDILANTDLKLSAAYYPATSIDRFGVRRASFEENGKLALYSDTITAIQINGSSMSLREVALAKIRSDELNEGKYNDSWRSKYHKWLDKKHCTGKLFNNVFCRSENEFQTK